MLRTWSWIRTLPLRHPPPPPPHEVAHSVNVADGDPHRRRRADGRRDRAVVIKHSRQEHEHLDGAQAIAHVVVIVVKR